MDEKPKDMWAVMKAFPFSSIDSEYIRMVIPKEGEGQPQRFIPVFTAKDDALKFAGDEPDLVWMIRVNN